MRKHLGWRGRPANRNPLCGNDLRQLLISLDKPLSYGIIKGGGRCAGMGVAANATPNAVLVIVSKKFFIWLKKRPLTGRYNKYNKSMLVGYVSFLGECVV